MGPLTGYLTYDPGSHLLSGTIRQKGADQTVVFAAKQKDVSIPPLTGRLGRGRLFDDHKADTSVHDMVEAALGLRIDCSMRHQLVKIQQGFRGLPRRRCRRR